MARAADAELERGAAVAPVSPAASARRSSRCSPSPARGSRAARRRPPTRRAPALDAAGRLEPRDRGDEVRAGQPVRGRERLAAVVVRRLLGHGGRARTGSGRRRAGTRAAGGRAGARRRARSSIVRRTRSARARAAIRDALDDEQPLAGLDEPSRRASRRSAARSSTRASRCSSARALGAASRAPRPARRRASLARLEVARQRPVVEEAASEHERAERRARSRRAAAARPMPRSAHRAMPARSPPRHAPAALGDVDLDHVRRARDVDRRAGGEHDAVARLDDARSRRAPSIERVQSSSTSAASGIESGVTPHSSAICCSACWWCVRPMIGRRGRSRATADAVRPVNGRDEDRLRAERLGEVAGRVRHRLADVGSSSALRQLVAVAEARLDRARDPVHRTRPPRPGTRRPPSRPRASPPRCRRGSRSRRRSPRRASARRACDHRLEHLRRGDHRLPALERAQDDPLLQQRHRRPAPISTPRSPRATITASASARIVVERVDRLGLLDLRDHARRASRPASISVAAGRARRPRSARTRARRSRRRARARTRGRPGPSRVSDGIGSGTPGRFTPLCELTVPPTTTAQRARPRSTRSTRSRTRPSSISTSLPGLQHVAEHGRADGQRRRPRPRPRRRPRPPAPSRADAARRGRRCGASGPAGRRSARAAGRLAPAPRGRAARSSAMLVVGAVREVEARAVHARRRRAAREHLGRRGRRPDRGDDLRAANVVGHRARLPSDAASSSPRRRETPHARRTAEPREPRVDLFDPGARRGAASPRSASASRPAARSVLRWCERVDAATCARQRAARSTRRARQLAHDLEPGRIGRARPGRAASSSASVAGIAAAQTSTGRSGVAFASFDQPSKSYAAAFIRIGARRRRRSRLRHRDRRDLGGAVRRRQARAVPGRRLSADDDPLRGRPLLLLPCSWRVEGRRALRLEGRGLRLFALGSLGSPASTCSHSPASSTPRPQSAALIVALAPLVTAVILWTQGGVRPPTRDGRSRWRSRSSASRS